MYFQTYLFPFSIVYVIVFFSNIQDVLKQAKDNAIAVNKKIRDNISKPWERVKNKMEGAKQLNKAMLKMEHDYVNNMKLRE